MDTHLPTGFNSIYIIFQFILSNIIFSDAWSPRNAGAHSPAGSLAAMSPIAFSPARPGYESPASPRYGVQSPCKEISDDSDYFSF